MRKGEEDQGTRVIYSITQILFGGLLALAVSFVFLFLCALARSGGVLPQERSGFLTVIACVLGSFGGGLFAVKRCGSRSLIVGVVTGVVLFLVLLTCGIVLYKAVALEEGGLPLAFGCLCGGALAGLLGARPKKKRRK